MEAEPGDAVHDLPSVLRAHRAWLLDEPGGVRAELLGARLRGAVFAGADLRDADLSSADLVGADFRRADLGGTSLSCADLTDADLRGAYLRGADLIGAYLGEANLRGADLDGAFLTEVKGLDTARLPGGFTFAAFKAQVVPALLGAGGRDPRQVVATSWDCHEWVNCPIARRSAPPRSMRSRRCTARRRSCSFADPGAAEPAGDDNRDGRQ